jgi:hypothetical protein
LGLITWCPFVAFFRVLEACADDDTSERSIQDETLEVLFAGLLRCVKKSFLGTAFACDFLVEKGHRSQNFNETGLLRNPSLVNKKQFWLL